MQWHEDFDLDDNSIWEANSPYTDGEGCSEFTWRLKQHLRGNKIVWRDWSDSELIPDELNIQEWDALDDAKSEIEKRHQEIITSDGCASK